jgi:hypothetical protein
VGETKLTIVWDGAVPGLPERRLSLSAFGPALGELVKTLRRVANDLDRDARGPRLSGAGVGRNTKDASLLDVQIETISANSPVTLACTVVPLQPPQMPLIANLGDRAVARLLDDIEMEASGRPAHFKVRQFVRALPEGLQLQRYAATLETGERRVVEIGSVQLPEEPKDLPHLLEFSATVAMIAFEQRAVRFRTTEGDAVTCAVTSDQIETAIELRDSPLAVLAVAEEDRRTRLLAVRRADVPLETPSSEARLNSIITDWDPLLALLAQ